MSAHPPRAMLLCAGRGTRLAPLTDHLPKPLIPVLNRPMLLYNLLLLREVGVREVVLNLHHLGRLISDVLGDGADLGMSLTYHHEEELLGTGGGLHALREFLGGDGGPCWVANGDSLLEADLPRALDTHHERGALGTMVLMDHPEARRYGDVRTDGDDQIIGIGRVTEGCEGAGPVAASRLFTGVSILSAGFFEHLRPEPSCVVRTAWKALVEMGAPVYGSGVATRMHDCGTSGRLLAATRDLLDHPDSLSHAPRAPHHPVAGHVVEPVVFGPGVTLGTDARVGPHVVLGAGASVAGGVRLTDCVVMPGVSVEADATGEVLG